MSLSYIIAHATNKGKVLTAALGNSSPINNSVKLPYSYHKPLIKCVWIENITLSFRDAALYCNKQLIFGDFVVFVGVHHLHDFGRVILRNKFPFAYLRKNVPHNP